MVASTPDAAPTSEAQVAADLVEHWLPELDAVVDKLVRGASVADASGGTGLVARSVAAAFPASRCVGVDTGAKPGRGYDLVLSLFRLTAEPDPAAYAARVAEVIARDGTWLIVEAPASPPRPAEAEANAHALARACGFHRWRRAFATDCAVGYEARQ